MTWLAQAPFKIGWATQSLWERCTNSVRLCKLWRGGEMPVNTLYTSFFQRFNQLLLIQPTTNAKWSLNRRDNNPSNDTRRCWSYTFFIDGKTNPVVKVGRWTLRRFGVQHHHQSVAMKGKVGLRLSDHFALVVGWINNNWLNLCKLWISSRPGPGETDHVLMGMHDLLQLKSTKWNKSWLCHMRWETVCELGWRHRLDERLDGKLIFVEQSTARKTGVFHANCLGLETGRQTDRQTV